MIPKREPQAHMGTYVGWSPSHASKVALVLNLRTGHISPQFYVAFDDNLQQLNIFARWLYLHIRQSWFAPQQKSNFILNIKQIHGNHFPNLIRKWVTYRTSRRQLLHLLEVMRGLILNFFIFSTMCKTIGCLFWRSLCKLNKRSILHLQQIPTPKTCGKCHQQLILIPVVYVVPLKLKYSSIVTRCTLTLLKPTKLLPCIQQANDVSNLPWCYFLLSVLLDTDCQV